MALFGQGTGFLGTGPEDHSGAEKTAAMQKAAQDYAAYRAMAAQQRQSAMHNVANLYEPKNRAMGQMYGAGAQADLSNLYANPMADQDYRHPSAPNGAQTAAAQAQAQQRAHQAQRIQGMMPPPPLWGLKDDSQNGPVQEVPFWDTANPADFGGRAPVTGAPPIYSGKNGSGTPSALPGFVKWVSDPLGIF